MCFVQCSCDGESLTFLKVKVLLCLFPKSDTFSRKTTAWDFPSSHSFTLEVTLCGATYFWKRQPCVLVEFFAFLFISNEEDG